MNYWLSSWREQVIWELCWGEGYAGFEVQARCRTSRNYLESVYSLDLYQAKTRMSTKKIRYQYFDFLLPELQNSSVKTESVSKRKIKHRHQLKNCCCLLRCFRFIVTKWPCGQTLTNFHFLYFRSDTFETRTKESKKSSADKSQTVLWFLGKQLYLLIRWQVCWQAEGEGSGGEGGAERRHQDELWVKGLWKVWKVPHWQRATKGEQLQES